MFLSIRPPVPPLGATMITTTTVAMLGAVVAAVAGAALAPAILPPAHAAAGEPGTLAFSLGEPGTIGPYEFTSFRSAAMTPDGKIVMLDGRARDALRVFYPNGTLYFGVDFSDITNGDRQEYVSVSPDGNIFVRDNYAGSPTRVFSPNGTQVSTFVPSVPGGYQLTYGPPVFTPSGNFVLHDGSGFGYAVFYPNGTHAFSFGQPGGYHGELRTAGHFDIGPDGKIFVDDHTDHFIEVFHPNGTHASIMHRFAGWHPGIEFAVGPAGEFLVYYGEPRGDRLYYLYYPNGTRAAVLSVDGAVPGHGPTFKFGPTGEILIFSFDAPLIRIFNGIESEDVRTGPWLYGPPWPPWPPAHGPPAHGPPAHGPPAHGPPLTLAAAAPAFVFGSYGEGPGEFLAPRNIAVGPGGAIAVSDAENNRVQLFYPNGTFALELGSRGSGPGELIGPLLTV